ncbi:MAG: hypothetical protein WC520_03700, partial [Candidatus Paceibacterota bacterium]
MEDRYYLKVGTARDFKNKNDRRLYRFFEMLVPIASFSILILSIVFSFKLPVFISFFIILYDIY